MVLNFKFNVLLNFISVYFVFYISSVKLTFIPKKYANFLLAVLGHHSGLISTPLLNLLILAPDILNWIKIIYNDVSSCVVNNGHGSTFFPLQRGVH